jgi:hypothetical protein
MADRFNAELQRRYDLACHSIEANCQGIIFAAITGRDPEPLRKSNAEMEREIGEIREEAARRGITLLSAKRGNER